MWMYQIINVILLKYQIINVYSKIES